MKGGWVCGESEEQITAAFYLKEPSLPFTWKWAKTLSGWEVERWHNTFTFISVLPKSSIITLWTETKHVYKVKGGHQKILFTSFYPQNLSVFMISQAPPHLILPLHTFIKSLIQGHNNFCCLLHLADWEHIKTLHKTRERPTQVWEKWLRCNEMANPSIYELRLFHNLLMKNIRVDPNVSEKNVYSTSG